MVATCQCWNPLTGCRPFQHTRFLVSVALTPSKIIAIEFSILYSSLPLKSNRQLMTGEYILSESQIQFSRRPIIGRGIFSLIGSGSMSEKIRRPIIGRRLKWISDANRFTRACTIYLSHISSKHRAMTQCWFNVWPASQIGPTSCVCWVGSKPDVIH